jgi:hypothetical protein
MLYGSPFAGAAASPFRGGMAVGDCGWPIQEENGKLVQFWWGRSCQGCFWASRGSNNWARLCCLSLSASLPGPVWQQRVGQSVAPGQGRSIFQSCPARQGKGSLPSRCVASQRKWRDNNNKSSEAGPQSGPTGPPHYLLPLSPLLPLLLNCRRRRPMSLRSHLSFLLLYLLVPRWDELQTHEERIVPGPRKLPPC